LKYFIERAKRRLASPNSNGAFTCRVRVKDAILALRDADVIRLAKDIHKIEDITIDTAEGS
jgi:hypothetical protein